jgi:hypothetical protein
VKHIASRDIKARKLRQRLFADFFVVEAPS